MLTAACGRGYWAIDLCLHKNGPRVVHSDSSDQGYLVHHHHAASELIDEGESVTHEVLHTLDSMEYSAAAQLIALNLINPRYPLHTVNSQHPPDFIPVPLYRPPRVSFS